MFSEEYQKKIKNAKLKIESVIGTFQIKYSEFTFVLDDDGTIYISTENFPSNLFERAYKILYELASQIYTHG